MLISPIKPERLISLFIGPNSQIYCQAYEFSPQSHISVVLRSVLILSSYFNPGLFRFFPLKFRKDRFCVCFSLPLGMPFLIHDLFSAAETGYISERNLFHQCDVLFIVTCTSWRLWRQRGVEPVWLCVYCIKTKWKWKVSLMLQLSQRKLSRCQMDRTDTKVSLHAVEQRFVPSTALTEILAFQVSIGTQMLPLHFVSEIKPITHGMYKWACINFHAK